MLQKKECGGMKAKCKVALEKCLDTSLDDSEATLRIFFVDDKLSRTLVPCMSLNLHDVAL